MGDVREGVRIPEMEGAMNMEKSKYCQYCGKKLRRKRFPSGNLENPKAFRKRIYCDDRCYKNALKITEWDSEIVKIVDYRWRCELCGEDRQRMFVNTKHGIRCGVCGYPAGKDEIVQLRVIKGEEVIDVGGEEDEW